MHTFPPTCLACTFVPLSGLASLTLPLRVNCRVGLAQQDEEQADADAEMSANLVDGVPKNGYRSPNEDDETGEDGLVYLINATVPDDQDDIDVQDSLICVVKGDNASGSSR